ncbi:hypothetical protein ELI25_29780 (plasmid) [Rhizobium ruizarguesonis]|uniref:hypothetical protein n=1 Tax=Rhizobium ruizarguesonis TaxID=2081791 RepID=UPI0010302B5D|nr:hypothetical protein [Rhizobium ruizarguesonis]TAW06654.1 hypothetical protein ELI25_29780 [Rhizobium ruizarguesonis]
MLMTVRVHEGYQTSYCTVEDPAGPSLRYRNDAVAAAVTARMLNSPSLIARESREIGLDWFGIGARSTMPAKRIRNWWEFTLDGKNDRLQVFGHELESDAREWLSQHFSVH